MSTMHIFTRGDSAWFNHQTLIDHFDQLGRIKNHQDDHVISLLALRAHPTAIESSKWSGLHLTFLPRILQALLEAGADPNIATL